jgi:hypothetical protein
MQYYDLQQVIIILIAFQYDVEYMIFYLFYEINIDLIESSITIVNYLIMFVLLVLMYFPFFYYFFKFLITIINFMFFFAFNVL